MMKTIAFAALAATVNANCDNSCSGHGSCTTDDVCSCYDNWGVGLSMDSGDCSDRICPFEIAWVDTPDSAGKFHRYAECAGRGICNRDSGLCECFDGYDGEACHRTTCPNLCSGHGTCEYIEDMPFYAVWNDYSLNDYKSAPELLDYPWWDKAKTRGCVCDAQYTDIDCSKRMCPYGTDILAAREDLLLDVKYQRQRIQLNPENGDLNAILDKTFALTFVSRLNETFTSTPIVLNWDDQVNNVGLVDFANDIRLALLHLPNQVIDGCKVGARVTTDAAGLEGIEIQVTFTGDAVQGPQNWLTVEDYECSSGCTPRITGLGLETVKVGNGPLSPFSNITESQDAIFNSYECGRRGKCDYDSGLCQCFEGYTGENCNTLTTLV